MTCLMHTPWASNSIPKYTLNKTTDISKKMYIEPLILMSKTVKKIINRSIQILSYSYNKICWDNQNEWIFSANFNMDESHRYNAEQQKDKTVYTVWVYYI